LDVLAFRAAVEEERRERRATSYKSRRCDNMSRKGKL
jgi:hypothetical protein